MDSTHGLALVRRSAVEYRRLVIGLGAAAVINVTVYALVVYPLATRVANVTEREQAAEQALASAWYSCSPAYSNRHDAVWLAWPWDAGLWGESLPGAQRQFVELCRAIDGERLEILVPDGEAEGAKRDTCCQGDLRTKPERRETEERGTFA